MAQAALAAIAAHINPGPWTKSDTSEENLRMYDLWYESYCKWADVCMSGLNLSDSQKWAMLVATGGTHLHVVVKEAEIEMRMQARVDAVDYLPPIPAGPNRNDPPE